jgi:hypothetical protein
MAQPQESFFARGPRGPAGDNVEGKRAEQKKRCYVNNIATFFRGASVLIVLINFVFCFFFFLYSLY